jgi:hypothetical protein
LLAQRRLPLGGWGHNRRAPVDGDSTAWVLRLALAVGESDSLAARAGRLTLERHRQADDGIVSYLPDTCPRLGTPILTPPDGSYAGWSETSHACVTANSALLGDEPARRFLRGAQREDGSWASYWWPDDEYATALAAEALAATGRPGDRASVKAAVRWTLARVDQNGSVADSPFATALALRTLRLTIEDRIAREARETALAWLLDQQQPDGSWRASAWSLGPRPDVIDRASSSAPPMRCLDEARTFTTSTVLSALTRSLD